MPLGPVNEDGFCKTRSPQLKDSNMPPCLTAAASTDAPLSHRSGETGETGNTESTCMPGGNDTEARLAVKEVQGAGAGPAPTPAPAPAPAPGPALGLGLPLTPSTLNIHNRHHSEYCFAGGCIVGWVADAAPGYARNLAMAGIASTQPDSLAVEVASGSHCPSVAGSGSLPASNGSATQDDVVAGIGQCFDQMSPSTYMKTLSM